MHSRRADLRLPAILLAATLALSIAAAGDAALPGDVRLARWLQANPIPFAVPLTSFTNDYAAGRPLTVAGIVVTLALLAARRADASLLIALATALRATNGLIKSIGDSPRPTPDVIAITEHATGLGFPSGHAMGATLLFGALAHLITRPFTPLPSEEGPPTIVSPLPAGEGPGVRARPRSPRFDDLDRPLVTTRSRLLRLAGVITCLVLILLTGYGRIHTGAHWPSDVLGGYLWGILLLAVAIEFTRVAARRGRISARDR